MGWSQVRGAAAAANPDLRLANVFTPLGKGIVEGAWNAVIDKGLAAQVKLTCPVVMRVGSFDGGTVVAVKGQTPYFKSVSALGGDVETSTYPNDEHFSRPLCCIAGPRRVEREAC